MFFDRYGKMKFSNILSSKLFWLGVLVKVSLSFFAASNYLKELFIPFIQMSIDIFPNNPYQQAFENGMISSFPYPAFMLWIMLIPGGILKVLSSLMHPPIQLIYLIYRFPLFIADFAILLILSRWLKFSARRVIIFYWLSPVLIYINYVHGQLDVIPIASLFIALYFLFKGKSALSGLFIGLAIAAKTHIILLIPFYLVYLWKTEKKKTQILYNIFYLSLAFLVINSFYFSEGFYNIVLANPKQFKIFDLKIDFQFVSFYVIPAALIAVWFKSTLYKFYNKDLFLVYLGFSFGLITLFIPPMQGWYYWVLPFFIYFYVKKGESPVLLIALQGGYFLYFAVIPDSDFVDFFTQTISFPSDSINLYSLRGLKDLKEFIVKSEYVLNITFTLLQTLLGLMCFWIFKKGILSTAAQKIISKPLLIGIGGNSGTGKTTITAAIENIFCTNNTTVLRGDDMHKWERGHEKWQELTHLDPKANFLSEEVLSMQKLKEGEKINRRHYDHSTGKFTPPLVIKPNKIIVFEGLHPFYLEAARKLFDIKIFMNPDEELYKHWKIIRDMRKRGYTKEKVLEQLHRREQDTKQYIKDQEKHADVIIKYIPIDPITDIGNSSIEPDIKVQIKLSGDVFFDNLIESIEFKSKFKAKFDHYYDNKGNQYIEFYGNIDETIIEDLAYKFLPQLENIGIYESTWQSNWNGILQLILMYYIFNVSER